jgi:hypothetical protein
MLGRTMLGKLPLVSTSFANLTTDDGLEAVSIATDYEKLIPIHYFYFPMILQVLRTQGPKVPCNGAAKKPHIVLECVLASAVQLFSKLCSVVSVEQAWKEVFPWRAALELGGLVARQEARKAPTTGVPGVNS